MNRTSIYTPDRRATCPRFFAYAVFVLAISFSLKTLPAAVINVDVQGSATGGSIATANYTGASANGPIASGTTWNHFDAGGNPPSASLLNLGDDGGTTTNVDVAFGAGWAGSFSDQVPNNLQGDRAFTNTNVTGTFTIGGLNPGGSYNLAMVTGVNAASAFSTDFAVGGPPSTAVDTVGAGAAANGPLAYTAGQTHALFNGVVADGSGYITFSTTNTPGASNGVLAGLQIEGNFAAPPTPSPSVYDEIINVDFNVNPANANYAGAGAVVDPGTFWNGDLTGTVTDATASDGSTATPIDVAIGGNNVVFDDGVSNPLHRDRAVANPGVSPTWSLSDLEIGREYDLLFYGVINATYTANAGITEGIVSSSITSGAALANLTPVHVDWIEDTHYTVLRFTANATTVSGFYTQPGGQSSYSGLQLARVVPASAVIPEPGTLALLSTGLLGLLFCGRRRKR